MKASKLVLGGLVKTAIPHRPLEPTKSKNTFAQEQEKPQGEEDENLTTTHCRLRVDSHTHPVRFRGEMLGGATGTMTTGATGDISTSVAGNMLTTATGEITTGVTGDMPTGVAGQISTGITATDPATDILLSLLQSLLSLF